MIDMHMHTFYSEGTTKKDIITNSNLIIAEVSMIRKISNFINKQ